MSHILKNKNIEIHIDLPNEGYQLSRFDWTGKIVTVRYKSKVVSGVERTDVTNDIDFGKGFYNEFGITQPIGYDEAEVGGWFHKIGIGLLQRDNEPYDFFKKYPIEPAHFEIKSDSNFLGIICNSANCKGYSYKLKKIITVTHIGFVITYNLMNTGSKLIETDEYVHNFVFLDNDNIGPNYQLNFPFVLKAKNFNEFVNQEDKLKVKNNEIKFSDTPEDQFFISNVSGSQEVKGQWELINSAKQLSIKEIVDFETDKINLWGWKHVISPELFFKIHLEPGESVKWSRTYEIRELG